MWLLWGSDLHYDSVRDHQAWRHHVRKQVGKALPTAVVVTGDIATADTLVTALEVISYQCEALPVPLPFLYVLGNHDRYNGSFADVSEMLLDYGREHPRSVHMTTSPPRVVGDAVFVGHDGWYDALGAEDEAVNGMMDFVHIEDLARARCGGENALRKLCAERAQEATDAIMGQIKLAATLGMLRSPEAPQGMRTLCVLTHVPPVQDEERAEAYLRLHSHEPDYGPMYVNRFLGEALRSWAEVNPQVDVTVLCGHVHYRSDLTLLPNLRVRSKAATYGQPELTLISI